MLWLLTFFSVLLASNCWRNLHYFKYFLVIYSLSYRTKLVLGC